MKRTVCDKHGTKYQLDTTYEQDYLCFVLLHGRYPVGRAYVWFEKKDEWKINDLYVENDVEMFRPWWLKIVCSWLGIKPTIRNYQGRGLSNILLEAISAEAHEYGIRRIWGQVHHKDRQKAPYLLHWCAKFGLREFKHEPGHPRHNTVYVELNL